MKLAGFIIIALSLVLGVLGAMTAYLPRLSLPDERLLNLTLAADAGRAATPAGAIGPIARTKSKVTPEGLAELRAANVKRIKVYEFAFNRWSEWWLFLLGCAGLFAGAMMVRRRASSAASAVADADETADASHTLEQIHRDVAVLREALAAMEPADAAARVLEDVGRLQRDQIPAFIAARPRITAQRGMSGYAQIMDAFAGAERQLNRAWSAAADDVVEESITCLERASELIEETGRRLSGAA